MNLKRKYTRVKCAIIEDQLNERLSHQPSIIELQLFPEDMYRLEDVQSVIQSLKKEGIQVFLHHPMKTKSGKLLDILSEDTEVKDFHFKSTVELDDLCEKEDIYCVVHAHYSGTESSILDVRNTENSRKMKEEIERTESFLRGRILWEDTIKGIFSLENPYLVSEIVRPLDLPFCHDVSHSFIAVQGNQEMFIKGVKELSPYVKYLHIVDSLGKQHDGRILGEGSIQWDEILPYIQEKPFIFEVALHDFRDATPMIQSRDFFLKIIEKD